MVFSLFTEEVRTSPYFGEDIQFNPMEHQRTLTYLRGQHAVIVDRAFRVRGPETLDKCLAYIYTHTQNNKYALDVHLRVVTKI